jgi:hypothetical protein
MHEIPARPASTTPVGEAFEQLDGTLRECWRRIAGLIQDDLDRAASGALRLEDLASYGPRLVRTGLANMYELAAALSDNLALLRSTPLTPGQVATVSTSVEVQIPADRGVRLVASRLTHDDGTVGSLRRLSFNPAACGKGKMRAEPIEVTLSSAGLRGGIYTGVVCVCADTDGVTLSEQTFLLPVTDLD